MRTTLSIDDDVLAAAKHLAERNGQSVSVLSPISHARGLPRHVVMDVLSAMECCYCRLWQAGPR